MSGKQIPRIKYRIKGWIDRSLFEELIKFSDYLGREEGESKFIINPKKAANNGYTLEEIMEILNQLGDKVTKKSVEVLEEKFSKKGKVILLVEGNKIIIKPQSYLGEILDNLKGKIVYNRSKRVFLTQPGYLYDVIDVLQKTGIEVIDRTSIQKFHPLPFSISFRGELRDYQKESLEAWKNKNKRGIIALPTGSGKTIIGIAALAEANVRTLIITYTKEQLRQWIEKIKEYTDIPQVYVSAFYSEEKKLAPITVSTYQTAYRHISDLAFRYSFLIVDEVHHLPADKFKKIALGMYSPYRMGLSATVVREDGRHVELFPLMGGIVYFKTPQELVDKGYLAPFKNFLVKIELTEEEKKKYDRLRKLYKNLAQGRTFKEILSRAQKGDPIAARALSVHSELKQLIQKAENKEKKVKEIVEKELEKGSKILVFTQYVDQANKLGELLNAPVLTGSTEPKARKRILEDFKNKESGVLVITTVGDEGLDIPDVNVGIVVAGTGSRRQFVQRLGRLLRPKPGKTSTMYEIITKGTGEEFQARKRKKISLDDVMGNS